MILSISELKTKWNKEKNSYIKKEVGDGVQKFVKDVLKSEELFNLKDGLVSTKLEHRKNEFTEESKTKAARRADIIIFINPEIMIPVEVEKYTKIEDGLAQLMQYQLDLDKKYGILTDGFTWRFYNNAYLLKEFTIEEIFKKPDLFKDFWREYIKPEFYYLSFFEEKGQLKFFSEDLLVEKKRQDFFRDITTLIRSFKNKLDIEGYFKGLEKKEKEKKAVEITYAYIIQFILYKTLVDNKFDDYDKEYKKRNKEIYECLKTKNYGKILGIINGISQNISQNIYRPFKKEQEYINNTLLDLFHKPKNYLHDVSPWLDIFVFIKKYDFANARNEIFGYIYENYLKELYEDTKKGQYFTDPAVVNFMLEQVGYNSENIKKRLNNEPEENYISLIDPSCGSGTFLYSATDRLINAVPDGSEESSKKIEELINNNIFGLDIAEFPLYLAEMSIVMRMLPLIINEKYNNPIDKKIKVFLTKDSIAEFIDAGINNTINDLDIAGQHGQLSLFAKARELGYNSYVRDEGDLAEMKISMRPPRKKFDFVIGNPPYVSYNESSKQGVLVVKLIQEKKVLMSDIYGMNLNTVPGRIKAYSPKPNLYSFFVALGLGLLKDNGKLCYIIPQTILTANDLDVLRYHLAKYTTIEKIITFSGKMFIGRGLKQNKPVATSSLVLVTKRAVPGSLHQVEIINYENSNDDVERCLYNISIGKKIKKKKILQNKLYQNISNWNFIKQDKAFSDLYNYYKNNTEDISLFRSLLKKEDDFFFDGGALINQDEVQNKKIENAFEIFDYEKNNWNVYSITKSDKYYSKSAKMNFPSGSQGVNTFLRRYKIIWRTRFSNIFQFTDRNLLLVSNQSLTVTSNSKENLLFYFALVNSPINKLILENNLKQENERNYFIPLRAIKTFIRIPKNIQQNQFIKDEIVKHVEDMLAIEDIVLSDLVDFSGLMIQKFDNTEVESNNLVLVNEGKKYKCKIKKDKDLVEKTIGEKLSNKKLFSEKINLADLKSFSAIDFDKQKIIKDYIDDLVFALYFNVNIKEVGINKAREIKRKCKENKFYKVINRK